MSDVKATKHTLSTNLNRLMEANLSLASNPKLAKRSKLGLGTIARIRNADVAINLDTLDSALLLIPSNPGELKLGLFNRSQTPKNSTVSLFRNHDSLAACFDLSY